MTVTEPETFGCTFCGEGFRNPSQLRRHPCGTRDAARRARKLRFPTEPVEKFLLGRYGSNTCETVEVVLGIPDSTWCSAKKSGLTDAQADQIACALGRPAEAFWPGWHNALDLTDDDVAWIESWLRGTVTA